MSSGLALLTALNLCHVQNAVHMGEPISRTGRECCSSSRALVLFDFSEKSHGMPSSGSLTVRSRARPGVRFLNLLLMISKVMRGGEYISDTIRLMARRLSRSRGRPAKPRCSKITLDISSPSSP